MLIQPLPVFSTPSFNNPHIILCPLLHAVDLVQPAAALAAALLDVTTTMGRLSAAGISFNTQPSPAAVAAALDLAAQVTAALSPYQHALTSLRLKQAHQYVTQTRQQPPQQLLVPPLYLNPLQQQQYQRTRQLHKQQLRQLRQLPAGVISAEYTPIAAQVSMKDYPQMWSLGRPVVCFYGLQLLQQWEQQLLQQQQQKQQLQQRWRQLRQKYQQGYVDPLPPPAAAAAAAASEASSSCGVGSSSSSRPAWQEAEGLLLLGAAALEGSSHQQQQQLQQQLALCRQYQQQFQHAATKLGLSSESMAAVAAWFTEAEQYSSSSQSAAAGSTAAAAAAAAADCLSSVCAAALMVQQIHMLVDPAYRESVMPRGTQLTAAEELAVADFFMLVCHTHCCCTAAADEIHTGMSYPLSHLAPLGVARH